MKAFISDKKKKFTYQDDHKHTVDCTPTDVGGKINKTLQILNKYEEE